MEAELVRARAFWAERQSCDEKAQLLASGIHSALSSLSSRPLLHTQSLTHTHPPILSVFLGKENLDKAIAQIAAGENVVFLANHQSEADPQVVSLILESAGYTLAEDMTFLAGHKVTTDALAIPFSMGRNLLCIHSKKHIDADPELKDVKQKQVR